MNRALLFSKFVKYNSIDQFIINTPSANVLFNTPVDIYIDIQSIYKHILSETLLSTDVKVLSINILNLAAHYRHYFYKHGVNTRIYIVNGTNNNNTIVSKINSQNQNLFTIVQKIVPYFPLVYYIEKPYNGSAIILSLLQSETSPLNHSSLIISNDIYSYQIPALVPLSFLLRPSTNTKFISYNNVINSMYPRNKSVSVSDLSPALLPVIMTYHKCPELGMEMLNNFKSAIGIIRNKIAQNQILNNYNSPIVFKNEPDAIFKRIYMSDLLSAARTYSNSYDNLINNWKIYKPYDINVLANILDSKFNIDGENLFNYLFLMDVGETFVKNMISL